MKKRTGRVTCLTLIFVIIVLFIIPVSCGNQDISESLSTQTESETQIESPESFIVTASAIEPDDPTRPDNLHTNPETWRPLDETNYFSVSRNGMTAWFDRQNGNPVLLQKDDVRLELTGLLIDVGLNGAYVMDSLVFSDFASLATYELPTIRTTGRISYGYELEGFEETEDGAAVRLCTGQTELRISYSVEPDGLRCHVDLKNTGSEKQWINGVLFCLDRLKLNPGTTVLYPGNMPSGTRKLARQLPNRIIEADLVTPVIMIDSEGSPFHLFFLNDQEKWRTGYALSGDNGLSAFFLSATEADLLEGESLRVGDLFIQFADPSDPYASIRDFYTENGWTAAKNGQTDGPVYSAHPAGTMDAGFRAGLDLFEYAEELDPLSQMGIEHIWLLPVFQHKGLTDVYQPLDMAKIDERYGGEAGAAYFSETAQKQNIQVLYDYVPHGPPPDAPLAKAHPEWCAVNREGKIQIEWDCVSFDMANKDYQQYLYDLVKDQISKFHLGGARIDCGMGGLPNWNPAPGNRPSNSNMAGGIAATRVIRQAFLDSGVKPLIISENFYPIPFYWPYSDLFYDMPFYRLLYTLNQQNIDEATYASKIVKYLHAEVKSKPEGVLHMRFLGNHDTVSWVFDQKRPQLVYGTEKARALWTLISFIDGVPMLYQGDEDPMIYGMGYLEDNRAFFKELFSARKQWLGSSLSIQYDLTPSTVIAFRRYDDEKERLVLINLSEEPGSRDVAQVLGQVGLMGCYRLELVYGHAGLSGSFIQLEPFSSVILDLSPCQGNGS